MALMALMARGRALTGRGAVARLSRCGGGGLYKACSRYWCSPRDEEHSADIWLQRGGRAWDRIPIAYARRRGQNLHRQRARGSLGIIRTEGSSLPQGGVDGAPSSSHAPRFRILQDRSEDVRALAEGLCSDEWCRHKAFGRTSSSLVSGTPRDWTLQHPVFRHFPSRRDRPPNCRRCFALPEPFRASRTRRKFYRAAVSPGDRRCASRR